LRVEGLELSDYGLGPELISSSKEVVIEKNKKIKNLT
jgi:hypothetical protein